MRTTKQLALLLFLAICTTSYAQEGTVRFLKKKTIFWGKKDMPLTLNEVNIGTLPSRTWIELKLKPGFYKFQSFSPFLSGEYSLEIKDGETIYMASNTVPNLADQNALNTYWASISAGSANSVMKKYIEGSVTVEGVGSLVTFEPAAQALVEDPAPYSATSRLASESASSESSSGGSFKSMLAAAAGGNSGTTEAAEPAAEAAPSGEEKSEEELKKEAVDGFFKEMSPLDIQEVIAKNKRQQELMAIGDMYEFKTVEGGDAPAEKESTYSASEFEAPPKLEKEFPNLKYRRSSVYTMIVNDTSRAGYPYILSAFGDADLPEKFNNHNVGQYLIEGQGGVRKEEEQAAYITEYMNNNDVAKKLVAKWFNRSAKGGFNMDLISKRGFYNASDLDVDLAKSSQRGIALLADAGEELIKNTFVLVNDYNFTNKEEVAKKVNTGLAFAAALASASGEDKLAKDLETTAKVVDFVGKGFVIRTRTYLYQLEWNDDVANQFYNEFWTTDGNLDVSRVNAFNQSDLFKMKLVGYQAATSDVQSTKGAGKANEELIQVATIKAQNKAIAKLEKTYEQFRTKTPLYSVSPLSAKIGLKEGISKRDKFEVLEQVLDNEGRTRYKRRAVIQVDPKQIWDNTYGADEGPGSTEGIQATVFKGNAKGLYEGMLIRQIN